MVKVFYGALQKSQFGVLKSLVLYHFRSSAGEALVGPLLRKSLVRPHSSAFSNIDERKSYDLTINLALLYTV